MQSILNFVHLKLSSWWSVCDETDSPSVMNYNVFICVIICDCDIEWLYPAIWPMVWLEYMFSSACHPIHLYQTIPHCRLYHGNVVLCKQTADGSTCRCFWVRKFCIHFHCFKTDKNSHSPKDSPSSRLLHLHLRIHFVFCFQNWIAWKSQITNRQAATTGSIFVFCKCKIFFSCSTFVAMVRFNSPFKRACNLDERVVYGK